MPTVVPRMSNVVTISVALNADLTQAVQAAVDSGEYVSSSEVIGEALREWTLRRTLPQHQRTDLQRLWQEGLDSGPGRLGSMDAIKREARRRFPEDSPGQG